MVQHEVHQELKEFQDKDKCKDLHKD
jgi:hypothetical protein